jgi:ribosomal 50S subunit-recycling heat shock protein
MRLDKFLKISLIFKTRSSGEKLIEQGHVLLNHLPAKPAAAVKVNDLITVIHPLKKITYKILMLSEKNVSRQTAREMFEIIHEESSEL